MKRQLLKSGIRIGTAGLNAIYYVMKILPQESRVVILSRQSNKPSQDIEILRDELTSRGIKSIVLCDRMQSGIIGAIRYIGPLMRQMHYLATSKVAVLDSYCIPACLLRKRQGLTIIQMWHALGAMKKFSKSILDKPEGKSSFIASLMKMHEGYDYIFTSSEKSRPAFAEAFGYPPEALTIMSLPRVDAILDKELDDITRERIVELYPKISERENILYVPTLRLNTDMTGPVCDLIDAVDTSKYNLIIKMHPLTEIDPPAEYLSRAVFDEEFSSSQMMSVADYVVTDYSAMTYDVALKGLPLYFYAFDEEEYMRDREFYLDYDADMPGSICHTAQDIASEIENENAAKYRSKATEFADLYIEKQHGCTAEIADLIESLL